MSDIKIQPSGSGTAVVTLTAPTTNTARTITFPDATGTLLNSGSTLDATKLSGNLPAISAANLTAIPAANITGTLPALAATNLTSIPAANITGTLPALSAANLTSIPAANITGTLPAISGASLTFGGAWTDYAGTSTIVGWSSFTSNRKYIFYKVIDKTLFCAFHLEGTSNSTTTTFTLPNTLAGFSVVDFSSWNTYCYNNNASDTTPGLTRVNNGSSTVTVYRGLGGSWTGSGTKIIAGNFVIPIV